VVLIGGLVVAGLAAFALAPWWVGVIVLGIAVWLVLETLLPRRLSRGLVVGANYAAAILLALWLAENWMPLGSERGLARNLLFVTAAVGSVLLVFSLYIKIYPRVLGFFLRWKSVLFLLFTAAVALGALVWLGFPRVLGGLPEWVRSRPSMIAMAHAFPGLGKEFMPSLDEGSFLYMPTTMPHAALSEAHDILRIQDMSIRSIPEVHTVVGKLGRAETPLDPAPVSMIETIIQYHPPFYLDERGRATRFKYLPNETDLFRDFEGAPISAPDGREYATQGRYERDEEGRLIPDRLGRPFRLWRPALDPSLNEGRKAWAGVQTPDDIWALITEAAEVPGSTSAPKLQPIETRIVMLQSGMRAPMGVKVSGPDLATIEAVGIEIEAMLKELPGVEPASVNAERIVGAPYLEIRIDREAIARHGLRVADVQRVVEVAIGGTPLTTTIEGRERYPVRARYPRELRDTIESLGGILVPAMDGTPIPLRQLASVEYTRGPQMIRNEDTFLTGYVLFDKRPGWAEVDVVEQAQKWLQSKLDSGEWGLPDGVNYRFAGSFENQIRATKRLRLILPLALFCIFLIIYFMFRSVPVSLIVFSGVAMAWSGGFMLIWLYGQDWFLNFGVLGTNLRQVFQIGPVNLSVAVWVGFIALFGIATDDGVVMASYIRESLGDTGQSRDIADIRAAVLEAGKRRVLPCMMTTATTLLALLPVLGSTGRGSDILAPMAIPAFGGMVVQILSTLMVPTLYCLKEEWGWKLRNWRKREEGEIYESDWSV
jgi:Cu(I)/Ag(I) efflux system membrane protein CusA/SilA